ncbi:hypothetical protein JXA84_04720 [candidate division WOR-3 bacterium]|nr:hypothetical protein [candidate division WOR-3 bacterium]
MNIISSIVSVIVLILFFSVKGSFPEALEREILYGFRVLSGFVLTAGIIRVVGVNFKRRRAGFKQGVSGISFLMSALVFFLLFAFENFSGQSFTRFIFKAAAMPLWTSFASLSGLAFSTAVLKSADLKKWESILTLMTASYFLLTLCLPVGNLRFEFYPGRGISFDRILSEIFEILFTGGIRGLFIGFFCLVFAQRIRVLIGREKRKDEYTP